MTPQVRLSTTGLFVRDLDKAVAFYSEALGLAVRRSFGSYVALDGGEGASALILSELPADRTPEDVGRGVMKLVFFTDDAAETVRRIVDAGGELVADPTPRDDLPYVIGFARDLDGHLLELIANKLTD
jgi:catechol 2,3-dioxygenase-like lactoylglutathione lyase family enzyme